MFLRPACRQALARLGALKWEEKSIPIYEKIEQAINALVTVRHNEDRQGGGVTRNNKK